jgi:hypothetical protein
MPRKKPLTEQIIVNSRDRPRRNPLRIPTVPIQGFSYRGFRCYRSSVSSASAARSLRQLSSSISGRMRVSASTLM